MYGEKMELITKECKQCGKIIALRVDPEDEARREAGMNAQDAFTFRSGKLYLDEFERELYISGYCGPCWDTYCPKDAVYS